MSEFNSTASLQTELKKHVEIINRITKQVAIPEGLETKNKLIWVKKGSDNYFSALNNDSQASLNTDNEICLSTSCRNVNKIERHKSCGYEYTF